ncbi:MAG: hypothetical protein R6U46_02400, partial [Marinilabilia sp.]
YVLDNRIHIVEEIEKDDMRIRGYVKQQLKEIINKGLLNELLMTHIHPLMLEERMPIVEEKIAKILK